MPAASSDKSPASIGPATHISLREGGTWHDWDPENGRPISQTGVVFAVRFDSGWVWDQLVGWRREHAKP